MKKHITLQQVFRRAVIISIISVLFMTAVTACLTCLIISVQKDLRSDNHSQIIPAYEASSLIMVQSNADTSSDSTLQNGDVVKKDEIDSSVKLANTVATLLTTDPEAKSIIPSDATVTAVPVEDSYFIRITVSSPDALTSANTANQLANTAPQIYKKYFADNGKVLTVEEASVPSAPVTDIQDNEQIQQDDQTLYIILIATLTALCIGMITAIISSTNHIKTDSKVIVTTTTEPLTQKLKKDFNRSARKFKIKLDFFMALMYNS